MLIRLIISPADQNRSGANQMRQHLSFREHFRRGNAVSLSFHPDRRATVKVPTPGEEDRRHLCRERKALTAKRVRHVNRIKGFLFSQGVSGYQRYAATGASGWKSSKPATAAPSLSILKRS